MKPSATRTLTGSAEIAAPAPVVYHALVEPAEQLQWNTLYLQATAEPPGPIRAGTIVRGNFKGTGPGVVTFQDVLPERHFVHHTTMQIRGITLGQFTHRYDVTADTGHTRVQQTVNYQPTGLGRLLAPLIMRSFRQRLPVSFTELSAYLTDPRNPDS